MRETAYYGPGRIRVPVIALACLWAAGAAFAPTAVAEEGKRVALIVGNNAYSLRPLANAINDARAMDRALQAAGFRTIVRENASKVVLEQATVEFLEKLGPDDTALFYYAGHAVQVENENVLIPVDFTAANTVIEAKFKSFSLALLFDYLKRTRVKRSIVIIDACRSNPVGESNSLQAGLAIPLNAGRESYIAFSTSPNHVAADNPNGKNSWFTEALADLIATPSVTLDEVFNRVRLRVERATEGKQTPWSQTSLSAKFYFHPPVGELADNDPTVVEKWMQTALGSEQREDWAEASSMVRQVLTRKPGGTLEQAARRKLPYLDVRREAQAKFEAADYAAAGALYEKALSMDPFALDAAAQGVNSFLLADRLPEALRLLEAIRVRGTSDDVARSNAMLKALAGAHPKAGEALQAGVPQPPPIEDVFPEFRFGWPDLEAGRRYLRASAPDVTDLLRPVLPAAPAPAAAPPAPAAGPPGTATPPPPTAAVASAAVPGAGAAGAVTLDTLHVELVSTGHSRDITIRPLSGTTVNSSGVQRPKATPVKVTTDPPGADLTIDEDPDQRCQSPCLISFSPKKQAIRARLDGYRAEVRVLEARPAGDALNLVLEREYGYLQLRGGQEQTAVLLDGKAVAKALPARLRLPAGKYEFRAVREGKAFVTRDVEIRPMTTLEIAVEQ